MKQSIQLFTVQLNLKKNLFIALTQIFGISLLLSSIICKKFGFNKNSLVKDVNVSTLNKIRKFIGLTYFIQNKAKKISQSSISELITLKSVRGLRHKLKLPVRGQRTRSNHKTQKKLS